MAKPFSISVDSSQLEANVRDHVENQLPYAISRALNETGKATQAVLLYTMARSFDRPTPYTLNSLRLIPATKQKLMAQIGFKDDSFKGTPATKYLTPEVEGGDRGMKRIESLLRQRGYLPAGMFVVPGNGAQLDAYGNFSRGQYSKILSQLYASRDAAQNETTRSRKRKGRNPARDVRYFVGQPGGGKLPLGVWARFQFAHGSSIRPILLFVKQPHYDPRFAFYDVAQTTAEDLLPAALTNAINLALATRRN